MNKIQTRLLLYRYNDNAGDKKEALLMMDMVVHNSERTTKRPQVYHLRFLQEKVSF